MRLFAEYCAEMAAAISRQSISRFKIQIHPATSLSSSDAYSGGGTSCSSPQQDRIWRGTTKNGIQRALWSVGNPENIEAAKVSQTQKEEA